MQLLEKLIEFIIKLATHSDKLVQVLLSLAVVLALVVILKGGST